MTSPAPQESLERPEANAFPVDDLIGYVRRGKIRIPGFQRKFKWQARHISALFDSMYRGYPVGSLVFWEQPATAQTLRMGGLEIAAPGMTNAWQIVDGQQRLASLAGVLLRSDIPPSDAWDDKFELYFDLVKQEFVHRLSGESAVPTHWLPVRLVGDTLRLLSWMRDYPAGDNQAEHARRAEKVARAIREYRFPAYVVHTPNEATLRVIFDRINSGGVPLKAHEVFNAVYSEGRLETLGQAFRSERYGTPDEDFLIKLVLGVRGKDITREFKQQLREDDIAGALQDAERLVPRMVEFLREDVGIPHLNLVPYRPPLAILLRFLHLHPDPAQESRVTLARWVWRGAVCEMYQGSGTIAERSVSALNRLEGDEADSVRRLWAEVVDRDFRLPDFGGYDFRTARAKLCCNALLSLDPRDLQDGSPIPVVDLVEERGPAAFATIFRAPTQVRDSDGTSPGNDDPGLAHLANRLVHPLKKGQSPLQFLRNLGERDVATCLSHGITAEALQALHQRDHLTFLRLRSAWLKDHITRFLTQRGGWD